MAYLIFRPATFETENGRGIADRERVGVYVAGVSILVINTYILLNTYRWDWLMVLVVSLSILIIFAPGPESIRLSQRRIQFYKAAEEVYGSLNYWAETSAPPQCSASCLDLLSSFSKSCSSLTTLISSENR